MTDVIYWVWLAEKNGAGYADALKLLKWFPGGAKDIYNASFEQIAMAKECSPSFLKRLEDRDLAHAEGILEFCFLNGIRIIPCDSDVYPARLRNIYNRPVVLYVRGTIDDLDDRFCVSIVGTRNMSNYGKRIAFNLTRKLIANGAIVISGAAYGIDSTVNNTAMYLNEPTVAVLGSGVNVPYPEKNKELLDWIGKNGMVVSEYPPNTPPNGRHFPVRNRIMSGLADAVVVVEAGEKSGAQITAQYAADQGRKVYAVPGNVGAPNSVGTNRMIRDGAKPVTCVEDILEDFEDKFKLEKIERVVRSEKYLRYEYNSLTPIEPENKPLTYKERDRFGSADGKNYRMRTKSTSADTASRGKSEKKADEKGTVKSGARKNEVLSNDKSVKQETAADGKSKASSRRDRENIVSIFDDTQRKVFDAIPDEVAVTSDTITRISGLPTDEVLSTLTMLELLAAVKALPGGLYKKII